MYYVLLFVNNKKVAHSILLNGTTANIIPIYMDILQDDNKNIMPFSLHIVSIILFLRFWISLSDTLSAQC